MCGYASSKAVLFIVEICEVEVVRGGVIYFMVAYNYYDSPYGIVANTFKNSRNGGRLKGM